MYIYISVTVNLAHLDCAIATAFRQQSEPTRSWSVLAGSTVQPQNVAASLCIRHTLLSQLRVARLTASASPQPFRLAMSLSRMAQTPYAGHSGEAPLQVLERLPHMSRHMLFPTSAPPRPVHVVIPSPYAAQSTPIPLALLPYGHTRP